MTITEQFLIKTKRDLERLNIIDWRRLNGKWQYIDEAQDTILSWFENVAIASRITIEGFHEAPERDDFPDWQHVGAHERDAKLFWNWFHFAHQNGELFLSDQPDFSGKFENGCRFWGDFGQVSASTFAYSQKQMRAHELWISVFQDHHVVIEPQVDIKAAHAKQMGFDRKRIRTHDRIAR